jgi:hypothetical protein
VISLASKPILPTYTAPTYQAPTAFKPFVPPAYNDKGYGGASNQASSILNPQYMRAIQDAMNSTNDKFSGSGFYGQLPSMQLSADASAQIGAQREGDIATLAQQILGDDRSNRDRQIQQSLGIWNANRDAYESDRSFGYNEFSGNRNFGQNKYKSDVDNVFNRYGLDYTQGRDETSDDRFTKEFNENKRQFDVAFSRRGSGGSGGGGGGRGSGGGGGGKGSGKSNIGAWNNYVTDAYKSGDIKNMDDLSRKLADPEVIKRMKKDSIQPFQVLSHFQYLTDSDRYVSSPTKYTPPKVVKSKLIPSMQVNHTPSKKAVLPKRKRITNSGKSNNNYGLLGKLFGWGK